MVSLIRFRVMIFAGWVRMGLRLRSTELVEWEA